ncbi:hypothetical protein SV7mr_25860 [Stieleria bergensis]|uniref:Uncharacterized protein n=1 Tax=Stieleria bergensis TaxID=2528025 RepID=A0A517SVC1_9BACT|nr:hypothetical protein SV7mr_25860 [Planctomycetes bacterium SV_7m_r]
MQPPVDGYLEHRRPKQLSTSETRRSNTRSGRRLTMRCDCWPVLTCPTSRQSQRNCGQTVSQQELITCPTRCFARLQQLFCGILSSVRWWITFWDMAQSRWQIATTPASSNRVSMLLACTCVNTGCRDRARSTCVGGKPWNPIQFQFAVLFSRPPLALGF